MRRYVIEVLFEFKKKEVPTFEDHKDVNLNTEQDFTKFVRDNLGLTGPYDNDDKTIEGMIAFRYTDELKEKLKNAKNFNDGIVEDNENNENYATLQKFEMLKDRIKIEDFKNNKPLGDHETQGEYISTTGISANEVFNSILKNNRELLNDDEYEIKEVSLKYILPKEGDVVLSPDDIKVDQVTYNELDVEERIINIYPKNEKVVRMAEIDASKHALELREPKLKQLAFKKKKEPNTQEYLIKIDSDSSNESANNDENMAENEELKSNLLAHELDGEKVPIEEVKSIEEPIEETKNNEIQQDVEMPDDEESKYELIPELISENENEDIEEIENHEDTPESEISYPLTNEISEMLQCSSEEEELKSVVEICNYLQDERFTKFMNDHVPNREVTKLYENKIFVARKLDPSIESEMRVRLL